MKRALLVLLAVFALGCERRKKLDAPAFTLEISPPATNVLSGQQKTFTARVVSRDGAVQDALPEWSLSSALLGTLSPQTGPEVTLTAGDNLGVAGTLQATHNGLTSTAQIWIGASPGNTATSYGFFSESTVQGIKFDIPNPSDPDGGYLGGSAGTQAGCSSGTFLIEGVQSPGEFTEGREGLKVTVSDGGDPSNYCGGAYMIFGFPTPPRTKDLSAYNNGTVVLDFRAPAGKEVWIKLEWGGAGSAERRLRQDVGAVFDDGYHNVSIPLGSFGVGTTELSQFKAISFYAHDPDPVGTFSFYLDNLRFERP